MRRRRYDSAPRTRLLVALLAIILQAFAVQTHVHAYSPASLASYEQSTGDAGDHHLSAPREHNACVLCQALASGRTALPTAADLGAPRQAVAEPTALVLAHAPQRRSHAWRSRAPPIVL